MVRIVWDGYAKVYVDGERLYRCEEIVRGERFDDKDCIYSANTCEYLGEYAIERRGENCALILGVNPKEKP